MLIIFVHIESYAEEYGPEGHPPQKPTNYSCTEFVFDSKIDPDRAISKAVDAFGQTLDYIFDTVTFRTYQDMVARGADDALIATLQNHTFVVFTKQKIMNAISDDLGGDPIQGIKLHCLKSSDEKVNSIVIPYLKKIDKQIKSKK